MTPVEISAACYAAAEIISVEERWTTGTFAKDSSGRNVGPNDKTVVCWCARGAVWRHTKWSYNETVVSTAVSNHQGGVPLDWINDNLGREAARAALLRTATLYAAEQGGWG